MIPGARLIRRTVPSRELGAARQVRIWLPASYAQVRRRRYPVLYLHDGQNVFSEAGPDCCHGWGSWELDRTADRLAAAGQLAELILVAVDNAAERSLEYRGPAFPYTRRQLAARQRRPRAAGDNTRFDRYTRFLCRELKPWVDANWRTLPGARHTGLMGSSLGGLCSLAVAWQHPRTFGRVASLSGAFQFEKSHFIRTIVSRHRGRRKPLKIYLDSGFLDFRDDDGRRHTTALAAALRRRGWRDGVTLLHGVDTRLLTDPELAAAGLAPHKWREARQSQHNELYWRLRAERALRFLFPRPNESAVRRSH